MQKNTLHKMHKCLVSLSFVFLYMFTSAARSQSESINSDVIVRMGTFSKAVDYAPYLVAKRKHWFEDALRPLHATISYDTFQTLPSINEDFASNRIDAVFEAEAPAIVGKAAGIDIKIAGLSAILNQQILIHKNSGITKVVDLKGKKIAVLAGTSSHYCLLKILEKAGLSKNDVSILDMTPPDAHSAFESNKIDAWAIWPPFVEQSVITGTGTTIPNISAQTVVVMTIRNDFVLQHKDMALALINTLNKSKNWVVNNPDEAQKIVSEELNLPLPVIQLAWLRLQWKNVLNDTVIADIQNKADFLKSVGFIHKNINVKDTLIDNSLSLVSK